MKHNKKRGRIYKIIAFMGIAAAVFAGKGLLHAERKINSIEQYRLPPDAADELGKKMVKTDFLILVNKDNAVPESFVPEYLCNLSDIAPATKSTIYLNRQAAEDYAAMIGEMAEAGVKGLYAVSGYRTYKYQENLYRQKINSMGPGYERERAEYEAAKVVAPPGASEHQTGLALDVSAKSVGYELSASFTKTAEYEWLAENCHRHGFVIRYQDDKRELTGIIFEPWHLRYVGKAHAAAMRESGECLEEYAAKIEAEVKR